ncbi:hypothetical protein QNM99_12890 [Pseudomonas sp. PCH446]
MLKKMIKLLSIVFFSSSIATALASNHTCSDIGLEQAYRPVEIEGITACFVYTETIPQYEGQLSRDPDGISIYSVSKVEEPKRVYEFLYAGTKGKINDVFSLPIEGAHKKLFFVLHSIKKPRPWETVSDIYEVSVIRLQDGALIHDQKLSRFFDWGGDFADAQGRPTYIYPYKDKEAVVEAVRSPLFRIAHLSTPVEGVIQEKSFLYNGDLEPSSRNKTKMYLIKGDRVTVKDVTAGWCKVLYAGKAKPITMWAQCKTINFPKG